MLWSGWDLNLRSPILSIDFGQLRPFTVRPSPGGRATMIYFGSLGFESTAFRAFLCPCICIQFPFGGPQLSRQNKKSRHYKLNSRQDNVIWRQNKINSRQNTINSRQNKVTHGREKFTHGKIKKTSWSAVAICIQNGASCNSDTPPFSVQCALCFAVFYEVYKICWIFQIRFLLLCYRQYEAVDEASNSLCWAVTPRYYRHMLAFWSTNEPQALQNIVISR